MLFWKGIQYAVEDINWLKENAVTTRLHRKKITAKARAQAKSYYKDELDFYKDQYSAFKNRASKAESELRTLKQAVQIVEPKE